MACAGAHLGWKHDDVFGIEAESYGFDGFTWIKHYETMNVKQVMVRCCRLMSMVRVLMGTSPSAIDDDCLMVDHHATSLAGK